VSLLVSRPATQRRFVAIELDDVSRADLADVIGRVDIHGLRPTAPQNLHLTVKFLGNVDPDRFELVVDALNEAVAGVGPFELNLNRIAFIPSARRARVLAAQCDTPAELERLVGQTESLMEVIGFVREDRPYRAHVTLGRFRRPPRAIPDLEAITFQPTSTPVRYITLMASDLQSTGPIYTALTRVPLAG